MAWHHRGSAPVYACDDMAVCFVRTAGEIL